jgi:uncharacterized membrane protein
VCANSESECLNTQYNSNGDFIVNYHGTLADLISIDDVLVIETFNIENKGNDSVSSVELRLNPKCDNIHVQNMITDLQFMTTYWLLTVNFLSDLQTNESTSFYISYSLNTSVLLESKPNNYRFEYISFITYFTLNYSMLILLPEESFIDPEAAINIYPGNHSIENIVETRRIAISWFQENQTMDQYFRVIFEPPFESRLTLWFSIFGPLIGIVIGIFGTIYVMRKRERKSVKEIGTVFLNETQKVLLKTIIEKGGKIAQNELSRKLGFTRSKTSRNLISLEKQGLVRREQWGRNTLVYITKTGDKVIE